MSFRGKLFALLLVFALAAAPASFAAEQANSAGLWQAFTDWLMASLGLGDEVEGGDIILPGGRLQNASSEGGYLIEPGGQPETNSVAGPGEQNEGGHLIFPGG